MATTHTPVNKIIDLPHAQDCAMRVVSAAECTCGKADAVAELEQLGTTYSLFHLMGKANTVCVGSVDVTEISYMDHLGLGGEQMRLSTADEQDYYFEDQLVALQPSGVVRAVDCSQGSSEAWGIYTLALSVTRPMCASDLGS